MKGIEAEFQRFTDTCLQDCDPEQVRSARDIYMVGAAAAVARFLGVLESDLPIHRKLALIRRQAREMQTFKDAISNEAAKLTEEA